MKKNLVFTILLIISIIVFSCKKNRIEDEIKELQEEEKTEAATLEIVSGDNQKALINTSLENLIIIVVKDDAGNTFSGTYVQFSVSEGSLSSAGSQTSSDGTVYTSWTLDGKEGKKTLTVSAFKSDGITHLTGSPLVVNAYAGNNSVSDIDGNSYIVVDIGNTTWMAENLKTTRYADGTAILLVEEASDWSALKDGQNNKGYCLFDNDESNGYGTLYTWYAAMNGNASSVSNPSGVQGVCPTGWHLPSYSEWNELINYARNHSSEGLNKSLKSLSGWSEGNNGTDDFDFTTLPVGRRSVSGNFTEKENPGWWNTEESDDDSAKGTYIHNENGVATFISDKTSGYSVRCVKN